MLLKIAAGDNLTSLDVLENAEEAEKKMTVLQEKYGKNRVSENMAQKDLVSQPQIDADSLLNDILENYRKYWFITQ